MTAQLICSVSDLVPLRGTGAIVDGMQVAIFYVPSVEPKIFAVQNFDPFSEANVMSRGIVGDVKDQLVVASPVYKQHFNLATGVCLEDSSVSLKTWNIFIDGDKVYVKAKQEAVA